MTHPVTVVHNHRIRMPDGVQLACRLWMPLSLETVKGLFPGDEHIEAIRTQDEQIGVTAGNTRYPSVLEILPYWKDTFTLDRDFARHAKFCELGFVCCRAEMRGTGNSDGVYFDEYTEQEMLDCEEVLNYIGTQSWSNEKISMFGKSWGGFNGLQMAARNPKYLATAISLFSTDDRYKNDVHYFGGCVLGDQMVPWANQMLCWNARPPNPRYCPDWEQKWRERLEKSSKSCLETWLKHSDPEDPYWKHGSVRFEQQRMKIPILAIGGLFDGYPDGAFRMSSWLNEDSRVIIGPWGHTWPDVALPGPNIDFLGLCHAWLSDMLCDGDGKGGNRISAAWPRLQTYVRRQHLPATKMAHCDGEWTGLARFPYGLERGDFRKFHLGMDGTLTPHATGESSKPVRVPSNAMQGFLSGGWMSWGGGDKLSGDQRYANAASLTWVSPRVERQFTIIGYIYLRVKVEGKGDLAARLCCENEDGSSTLISFGVLSGEQFVKENESGDSVGASQCSMALVEFKPTTFVVEPGGRLTLAVSGALFPIAIPSESAPDLLMYPDSATLFVQTCEETISPHASLRSVAPSEVTLFQLDKEVHAEAQQSAKIEVDVASGDVSHTFHDVTADTSYPMTNVRIQDQQTNQFRATADAKKVEVTSEHSSRIHWQGKEPIETKANAVLVKENGIMSVKESLKVTMGGKRFFEKEWSFEV